MSLAQVRDTIRSLDTFLEDHTAQLEGIGMPRILFPVLWAKLEAHQLGTDAFDHFEWEKTTVNGKDKVTLVAKKDLPPQQALIVYEHDWTFVNRAQAKEHLDSNEGLRGIMSHQVHQLDFAERGYYVENEEKKQLSTDEILMNLYRIAFQYQAQTEKETIVFSYASFDPFGPHIIPFAAPVSANANQAHTPLLEAHLFVHTTPDPKNPSGPPTSKPYTILFPSWVNPPALNELRDADIIRKGTPITRGELTTMADYSNPRYWTHHYAQSQLRSYDWFLPWKAVGPVIKNLIPERARQGVCLNVGCGNAPVGEGIIKDGLAGYVISCDVAVEALKAVQGASNGKPGAALEELIQLDASRLPLREGGGEALIDWAFDKGTLDGLMDHPDGVAIVKAIWDGIARRSGADCVFVLVSLGRPEGRLVVIEEAIGGWEVEECMEVEIPGGAVGMGKDVGGRIDRVFIYVCKKK
ncbi:hypothetical protein HK101_008404 [Irineochytrium annulatum]|nr:hypothetical protein HK101_008404 [Irineochytrium annulatum]